MSFYSWMKRKYKNESNLFGGLVRLMDGDAAAPKSSSNEKIIRRYLISKKIPLKMMRAFAKSFKKYEKEIYNGD